MDRAALDTGPIEPGSATTLQLGEDGTFLLLCHPHPFMLLEVTVVPGGPVQTHVHIFDGPTLAEYRFEPRNVTVGPGALVEYPNHGALEHTATQADGHAH